MAMFSPVMFEGLAASEYTLNPKKSVLQWQLGKAVNTMQFGLTITDLRGTILYTNPAEAKMHGYTVDELVGQDLGILAPPELRNPLSVDQMRKRQHLRESINIRKDGSIFPVRLMSNIINNAQGDPVSIVTMCEDITENKRASEKLRQHSRELALLNHLSDSLQECDEEEKTYPIVAEVCQKLFPSDSGCLCIMKHAGDAMMVVTSWGTPPKQEEKSEEGTMRHSDQDEPSEIPTEPSFLCPHHVYNSYQECLSIPIVASDEILGLLSLCFPKCWPGQPENDYPQETRSKQMLLTRIARHYALALVNLRLREQLKIEAMHDPLTGLYNRRYMEDSLKREAYRAKRQNGHIGIIMLDIDHFKLFNDLHGHKVGDMVLRELGQFLKTRVRGEDIACRYGGEEFLLILPNTTIEITTQRAEELRLGIKDLQVIHEGKQFRITISAGVAALPSHGSDMTNVVHHSDLALYQAKNQGRDRVIVAFS